MTNRILSFGWNSYTPLAKYVPPSDKLLSKHGYYSEAEMSTVSLHPFVGDYRLNQLESPLESGKIAEIVGRGFSSDIPRPVLYEDGTKVYMWEGPPVNWYRLFLGEAYVSSPFVARLVCRSSTGDSDTEDQFQFFRHSILAEPLFGESHILRELGQYSSETKRENVRLDLDI